MGMFDRFSRRRRPEPVADLREALIAAFCAEQYEVMKDLINANVEAIRESFPKWTTAPDEIAKDPVALERYARTLITIAGLFEGAGDASLMNCLRLGAGNPLAALETDVARAQTLIDEKRPEKFPSFAPGWNEHAEFVEDPLKRLEVIENGLAARPDPHTRGLLMVKKAWTMSRLGDVDGASRMLQTLASDSTGSLSARALAEIALARLSSPPSL